MKTSPRIAQVIRLARRREDQAAALLREWQARLSAADGQLAQLTAYRDSYLVNNPLERSAQSMAIRAGFVSHLADVIASQEQIAQQLARQLTQYQAQWRLLHRKRELLEDYGERQALDAIRQLDKLWDRLCDDMAAQKYSLPD